MINGYRGNSNLKPKNIQLEWSQERLQEYLKCSKDPIYFAEKYIQIVHVDRGLIPIILYDYQKEIMEKIANNRRVAVNTSRQAGKTTTAVAVILHYILFNDRKTVALLANKGDSAREILDRIKIAYEALPDWIQQGVIEFNKGSAEFENGSKIIAASTSSTAIRGKSVSFLYIDETAFVEHWDDFFASVLPTISSGNTTKMLFTSTPSGLNHFYKTCVGAKEGTNGYEYVEVPWQRVPGRDDAWKKETLEAMEYDYQKFSQEFECVTGDTIVTVRDKETLEIKEMRIDQLYKELMKYDVLTPSGWSNFRGIKRQTRSQLIDIITETGKSIVCTENHKLKSVKYGWIEVDCLEIDDIITTIDGHDRIIYKKRSTREEDVYDLLEVSKNNEYYTNGILSHNCEFQGSSGTLIGGNKLKALVNRNPINPITENQGISMYKTPVAGHTYVCVADVSRGKGLDYSAFQIIDVSQMPYEQVCVFRDNMVTPVDYAEVIYRTTKGFNNAYILVEINDIGEQVSEILSYDFDVETLLFTESAGRSGKRISGGFSKGADKGIRTTKTVKSIGCNILKMLVERDQLIIHDWNTINELSKFSRKANSYQAESGSHDDLVMCLVLFSWLSDQMFFKEITDINTMWKLRERSDEQIESDMLPFGFMDDGHDLDTRPVIDLVEDNWLRF